MGCISRKGLAAGGKKGRRGQTLVRLNPRLEILFWQKLKPRLENRHQQERIILPLPGKENTAVGGIFIPFFCKGLPVYIRFLPKKSFSKFMLTVLRYSALNPSSDRDDRFVDILI
jgi:hypothetical protein